jgi:hypothetical protein
MNLLGFVQNRVSFPLIHTLKKYERIHKPRVAELVNQIITDKKILNPIVWDSRKNLLID